MSNKFKHSIENVESVLKVKLNKEQKDFLNHEYEVIKDCLIESVKDNHLNTSSTALANEIFSLYEAKKIQYPNLIQFFTDLAEDCFEEENNQYLNIYSIVKLIENIR